MNEILEIWPNATPEMLVFAYQECNQIKVFFQNIRSEKFRQRVRQELKTRDIPVPPVLPNDTQPEISNPTPNKPNHTVDDSDSDAFVLDEKEIECASIPKSSHWSKEEEKQFIALYYEKGCSLKAFNEIAKIIGTRTKQQCVNLYHRLLRSGKIEHCKKTPTKKTYRKKDLDSDFESDEKPLVRTKSIKPKTHRKRKVDYTEYDEASFYEPSEAQQTNQFVLPEPNLNDFPDFHISRKVSHVLGFAFINDNRAYYIGKHQEERNENITTNPLPPGIIDPLFSTPIIDPVITSDGFIFDYYTFDGLRWNYEEAKKTQYDAKFINPYTQLPLRSGRCVQNLSPELYAKLKEENSIKNLELLLPQTPSN